MLNIEKLRFGSPRKCDLLVFDEVSASALGTMLFESMEYSILYKRNKRIHFGIQILRRFIFNLLKTQLWTKWPMNIRLQNFKSIIYISYLLAWIQCVNPRVVITFIDNDWHFQLLSRLYEEANFIAIQNGVRSMFNLSIDLPLYPHPGSKISMPLLYCFGQCEKETYPMFGHKVDQISPVGSLTASWYREKVAPKITCPIIYDILLISQWERMIMIDGRFPEIAYSLKRLDLFINKFISTNKINFAIALRSSDPKEIEYFKNQYGDHITIIEKNMKEMSSYRAVDQAYIILTLDSTLGREAYGWGKKVLFVNLTGQEMYRTPVDASCYLEDNEYDKFKKKINKLYNESYSKFNTRTKKSREWLIGPSNYTSGSTRKIILDDIRYKLQVL